MEVDTKKVLHRIKRRLGRERARYDRWAADVTSPDPHRNRCHYEANMLSLAMGYVDDELRKLEAP